MSAFVYAVKEQVLPNYGLDKHTAVELSSSARRENQGYYLYIFEAQTGFVEATINDTALR
jgi:hypothetical protein